MKAKAAARKTAIKTPTTMPIVTFVSFTDVRLDNLVVGCSSATYRRLRAWAKSAKSDNVPGEEPDTGPVRVWSRWGSGSGTQRTGEAAWRARGVAGPGIYMRQIFF